MTSPVPQPLPLGTRVVLDADTRIDGATVSGGSPSTIFRLNARARKALAELEAGTVRSPDAATLGRRLSDAGALHPVPPPASTAETDVTVVIPVRDRAAELDRCLTSLAFGGAIVVVDDGSDDPAAVAAIAGKHGARLVTRPNGGPAAARNTGLRHVTTPVVAFLDSDCLPPPDWIAALLGHFDDPLVVAAAPRIVGAGPPPETSADRFARARPVLDLGDRPARVQPLTLVSYVPTAALLIRTAAANFDESLRYGEDVDLIWRLLDQGHRIRFDPRVTVGHVEPVGWKALLRRRYQYGTSAAALEIRHPGRVAPLVLVTAPTVVVAGWLTRQPLLAGAAFAAGYADIALALRRSSLPVKGIARPLALGVRETFIGSGRWTAQFALPLALAVALPRSRRVVMLAAWVGAAPVRDWVRKRPPLNLFEYTAGVLVDDAAYGAGVWAGSLRHHHPRALLPRWRWRLVKN